MKKLVFAVAASFGAALALAVSGFGHVDVVTLKGTVGPGFTISLTRDGKRVTKLTPGTYRFVIADRSNIHNFAIEETSGTFEKVLTTVGFVGTKAVTLKLAAGSWEFYCVPHQNFMKGSFVVKGA